MRRLAALLLLFLCALLAWRVMSDDDSSAGAPDAGVASVGDDNVSQAAPAATAIPIRAPRVREHAEPAPRVPPSREQAPTTAYTVRVTDRHGTPVPGVVITLATDVWTDAAAKTTTSVGSVSWNVPASAHEISVTSPLFDRVQLRHAETVVQLDDLLPLEIRFTDQETGRPLGVWVQGSPLETDNVLSNRLMTTFTTRAAPVRAGRSAELKIWFGPPEGYVVRRGYPVVRSGLVSRYATAVRTTVPVARELKLRVRVLRHDGSPAGGATATVTVTGTVTASARETTGADGDVSIPGLPFLRGEHVRVFAGDEDGRRSPTVDLVLVDPARELSATVRLPEHPQNTAIGIGGGFGSSFSDRVAVRREPPGTARLTVALTRRNGLPAAGARVLLQGPVRRVDRADASGRVAFERLATGTYTVILREPGLVATSDHVDLAEGEEREIAMRETTGRDAIVRVLGADGLPLPNVRVRVELPWGEPHIQLNGGGVQELDLWTDVSGRAYVADLPAGPVTVTASLGSRRVRTKLARETLQITLPNS